MSLNERDGQQFNNGASIFNTTEGFTYLVIKIVPTLENIVSLNYDPFL